MQNVDKIIRKQGQTKTLRSFAIIFLITQLKPERGRILLAISFKFII